MRAQSKCDTQVWSTKVVLKTNGQLRTAAHRVATCKCAATSLQQQMCSFQAFPILIKAFSHAPLVKFSIFNFNDNKNIYFDMDLRFC